MLPASGALPDADRWKSARLGACWLGHATVLLRLNGLTILTDPHFGDRAGPRIGPRRIGRTRSTALPCGLDDLPPIDLVLLSHAHLDHWDRATLKRLAKRHTQAVIPARTRRILPRGFGGVVELPWDSRAEVRGLTVSSLRPRHWGARWLVDRRRGYNAYLLSDAERRVLFAGDTAHTDSFERALGAAPGLDLAIMGIGNYAPWEHQHATPEQVAGMARNLGARRLMPIHHSTFRDTSERIGEPLERLVAAWDGGPIVCPRIGESWIDG